MKNLIVLIAIAVVLLSCGTIKKTEQKQTSVHTEVSTKLDSSKVVSTETKTFGDTLSANLGYLLATDSVAKPQTFTAESKGLKVSVTLTPKKDTNGVTTGYDVSTKAIAKPTTVSNTTATVKSNFKQVAVKDTTGTSTVDNQTKVGPTMPIWFYCLWGLIIIGLVIYLAKRFKII